PADHARKWWMGELARRANEDGVELAALPITPPPSYGPFRTPTGCPAYHAAEPHIDAFPSPPLPAIRGSCQVLRPWTPRAAGRPSPP
ncbi:hypothetical protein ACH4TQ_34280, partial [Streptomyces sp. NPDC021218]|uniref:hypothetical protein n=1 Tax=Streptomyces sp. NPDC021218 TaxID=3365119 RepID=UPI00378FE497